MAELTDAQRQDRYKKDCLIINAEAEIKLDKIAHWFADVEVRHEEALNKKKAVIEARFNKKKVALKAEWDRKLAAVKPGNEFKKAQIREMYDGLDDIIDLDMEQTINYEIEQDMRELEKEEVEKKKREDAVERWRAEELASELHQLQTKTQRQRKLP